MKPPERVRKIEFESRVEIRIMHFFKARAARVDEASVELFWIELITTFLREGQFLLELSIMKLESKPSAGITPVWTESWSNFEQHFLMCKKWRV